MICPCTRKSKHPRSCRRACPVLERELKKCEAPQREILLPPDEVERRLDAALSDAGEPVAFRQAALAEAIALLSPMQRACMGLYAHADMSPTKIAETLVLSRSAVRTHLRRAAARLFGALGEPVPEKLQDLRPRHAGLLMGEKNALSTTATASHGRPGRRQLNDKIRELRHAACDAQAS